MINQTISPEFAMNQLWHQGYDYLCTALDKGIADQDRETELGRFSLVGTDDEDLVVSRLGDDLEIEATLDGITYRFEWGWDIRDLPVVSQEKWVDNRPNKSSGVALRNYGMVAAKVSGLIAEAQSSFRQDAAA